MIACHELAISAAENRDKYGVVVVVVAAAAADNYGDELVSLRSTARRRYKCLMCGVACHEL